MGAIAGSHTPKEPKSTTKGLVTPSELERWTISLNYVKLYLPFDDRANIRQFDAAESDYHLRGRYDALRIGDWGQIQRSFLATSSISSGGDAITIPRTLERFVIQVRGQTR
jgi:hypothetical protein